MSESPTTPDTKKSTTRSFKPIRIRPSMLLAKPALFGLLAIITFWLALLHRHTIYWLLMLGFCWCALAEVAHPTIEAKVPSQRRSVYRSLSFMSACVCFFTALDLNTPYPIWNWLFFVVFGIMSLMTAGLYIWIMPKRQRVIWRLGLVHGIMLSALVAAAAGLSMYVNIVGLPALCALVLFYITEQMISWAVLAHRRFSGYVFWELSLTAAFGAILIIATLLPLIHSA